MINNNTTLEINKLSYQMILNILDIDNLYISNDMLYMYYEDMYNDDMYGNKLYITNINIRVCNMFTDFSDVRINIKDNRLDLWNIFSYHFGLKSIDNIKIHYNRNYIYTRDKAISKIDKLYKLIKDGILVIKYN